ncbi:MAG: hypothetical protein H6707_00245 [Deltaproteobacteria bacterium]|nr:hypothetical protein [Deltaproteobacteria bacterium]
MTDTNERACPQCSQPLVAINVVDQLGHGRLGALTFTLDEAAKTSAWSGKVKNAEGVLKGYLCPSCDRVLFYAQRGD